MRKRVGRPPVKKTELRRKTISLRLKSDEVNMLRKAAAKQGKTLSSWVRQALMKSVP
jgi:uncharacterized protein (DUF1778 family)